MSFKIGNPLGNVIKTVEDKAGEAAKAVTGAVNQAKQTVENQVDAFEKKAADTVKSAKTALDPTLKEAKDFIGATADSLKQAVGLKPAGNEPAVLRDQQGNTTYGQNQKPLFVNEPSLNDIAQGQAGDCYFLSSVASLAQNHPDAIKNAIKQNPDGTYTVTFHVPEGFGAIKAFGPAGGLLEGTVLDAAKRIGINVPEKTVQVTVDPSLPVDKNGNPVYVQSKDSGEAWPQIMEKAYAKLWGSYGAIGNGGDPATAMRALTGGNVAHHALGGVLSNVGVKVGDVSVSPQKANEVFSDLKAATEAQKLVVASTYNVGTSGPAQGIVSGHCYTVVGVSEENGQKYVSLRNPWGNYEPGNDGNDDGVFKLPVEQFIQQYASYDVGEVK